VLVLFKKDIQQELKNPGTVPTPCLEIQKAHERTRVCRQSFSTYLKALTCATADTNSLFRRVSMSEWMAVSVLAWEASAISISSIPLSDAASASFRQLSKRASSSDMLMT